MLAKKKVRMMTRLSIFEESTAGKKALSICRFFKNDYIRWELIKTAISYTIGFAILFGLYVIYNLEKIVGTVTALNPKIVGQKVLSLYILFLVIYLVFTFILASFRYRRHKKNFNRYDRELKRMEEYYKDTEQEEDSMEDDK